MALFNISQATFVTTATVLFLLFSIGTSKIFNRTSMLGYFGIFLLSTSISALWRILLYPKFFSPLRHLPGPSNGTFFHGQLWRILSEPTGMPMRDWINSVPNEGLIRFTTVCNQERLFVTTPEGLGEVMVTKSYDWQKPVQMRKGLGRILGVGVLLADGDEHKIQRKNLLPAFQYRHVKNQHTTFWDKACELLEVLESSLEERPTSNSQLHREGIVNISDLLRRITLDVIGLAGMGYDFNAIRDPDNELNVTYRQLFHNPGDESVMMFLETMENFLPVYLLGRLPLKYNVETAAAAEKIRRISRQLIQDKRRKTLGLQPGEGEKDILSVAMESEYFSEEGLIDQTMTFLAAGHETTSAATTWACIALCQHLDMQEKLRAEIRAQLPSPSSASGRLTAEAMDRLPYLHAVCNEVLRLYAPVPLSRRESVRDTTILGQAVPRGTSILLVPAAVNVSRQLWGEDAEDFNPERWMAPKMANSGGARSNYANLTFMHGPRACIGAAFAKAEFACLVAALVGRFEMAFAAPSPNLEVQPGVTLRLREDLHLQMQVREGW